MTYAQKVLESILNNQISHMVALPKVSAVTTVEIPGGFKLVAKKKSNSLKKVNPEKIIGKSVKVISGRIAVHGYQPESIYITNEVAPASKIPVSSKCTYAKKNKQRCKDFVRSDERKNKKMLRKNKKDKKDMGLNKLYQEPKTRIILKGNNDFFNVLMRLIIYYDQMKIFGRNNEKKDLDYSNGLKILKKKMDTAFKIASKKKQLETNPDFMKWIHEVSIKEFYNVIFNGMKDM